MSKKLFSYIVALSTVWLVPLEAEELQLFNFNIGGGISAPLNPIARFVGVSGNFVSGAGVNLNKHSSIEGDFMWSGLPPNLTAIHPVLAPRGSMNLYSLTANYRYHLD